jgi:hypothetical protein
VRIPQSAPYEFHSTRTNTFKRRWPSPSSSPSKTLQKPRRSLRPCIPFRYRRTRYYRADLHASSFPNPKTSVKNKENGRAFRDFLADLFRKAIAESGNGIRVETEESTTNFIRPGVTGAKDAFILESTGYGVTAMRAKDFLK